MSRPKLDRVITEFGLYPDVRSKLGAAEAVDEFKKHIDFRAPGGDTFSIAFSGTSPIEAQKVTSRLSSLVIQQDAELRRKHAAVTRDFLVTEKSKAEAQLRTAERDLAAFMAEHPRFALDTTPLATGAAIRATAGGGGAGPAASPSRPLVSALRVPAALGTPAAGQAPRIAVEADSDFARANAALAAARSHLAEQLERFTPAHPDVRAAAAAVERAESRLSSLPPPRPASPTPAPAAIPPSGGGPPAARPSNVSVRSTTPPLTASAAPPRDVVALETEWLKLTRAVTEARQRYDQVESALFKADILASSESGGHGLQMTVIDPAFLPARPLPPGRTLIAAIFFAASLVLGLLLALLRAVLDDRIYDARDTSGLAELLVEVPSPSSRSVHVPG
jgi:hypothetical protein